MPSFNQRESNAAQREMHILLVDVLDGVTPIAGETPICNIKKPGVVGFAPITGSVVEVALGTYTVLFSVEDLDTPGDNGYYITSAGAQTSFGSFQVVELNRSIDSGLNVDALASTIQFWTTGLGTGHTLYAFIKRMSDGRYYNTSGNFTLWDVEASHRIAFTEDVNLKNLYVSADVVIDPLLFTDGEYVVMIYKTSIHEDNLVQVQQFGMAYGTVVNATEQFKLHMRAVGLCKENMYLDNAVYVNNNMTSCRIRTYAAAPIDPLNDTPIATYNVTITYTGRKMTSWTMEKV